MKQKLDVPLGIVVAGLILAVGSRVAGWTPGAVLGAAVVLGGLAVAWAARNKRGR